MEISTKYNPAETEQKWYSYWEKHKLFKSTPDERDPYTIVIPPPNVTGVLHMGHMLNNTIQDILVRRARMQGKNAVWVPGTDHASIATETKVVKKLRSEGIKKSELTREDFLKHAWEWTREHGGIILEQLKRLGASCDWDRTAFTMDESRYESVLDVFIDLYNKGHVYRGLRMINWDPEAKTAVSDEEVIYKEIDSKLYYAQYKIAESEDEYVTIATTRPETILGDTAVCVNPNDERYQHLAGKNVIIPLVNREVPVIFDEQVDMEFGTGCLKITPAHDENDYEIGQRHNLETLDILNDDGTLHENAQVLVGEDRFDAREKIIPMLKESGNYLKEENYVNKVGYSERTEVVIEPKLSMQWFVKMENLAKPALDAVVNDEIKLHPQKFKTMYRQWMENIKDWCISRQLWWGHRIPAYYLPNGEYVVAKTPEEALEKAQKQTGDNSLTLNDIKQDEDVLDTWFSSWLWPISVFDGIRYPDNEDINYYYPTDDLITAPEILFFWVARMIIAGYEYRNEKPFKNIYLTGIVRDDKGRKMSKQFGNSPDPIGLIDRHGADGVRVGILLSSVAGNDLLFNENLTEQGRNFANKIWNAFRLISNWEIDKNAPQPDHAKTTIEWFQNRLYKAKNELDRQFNQYRISDALMNIYRLFWDDFASWFLEIIKPNYGEPIDKETSNYAYTFLDDLLKLLHPFMPFITEEIWQRLEARKDGDSIMISLLPQAEPPDENILEQFEQVKEISAKIRTLRKNKDISNKETCNLNIKAATNNYDDRFDSILQKLNNLEEIKIVEEKPREASSFIVKNREYFVPLSGLIDVNEELEKLRNELDYTKGFLEGVMKKLNNERFVQNAPEDTVNKEKQKKADAETKIKALEEQIRDLEE